MKIVIISIFTIFIGYSASVPLSEDAYSQKTETVDGDKQSTVSNIEETQEDSNPQLGNSDVKKQPLKVVPGSYSKIPKQQSISINKDNDQRLNEDSIQQSKVNRAQLTNIPKKKASKLTQSEIHNLINNYRLKEAWNKPVVKKRYLVLYPNGTIDHVDKLETVVKKNPNYVLVNKGQLLPGNNEVKTKTAPKTHPLLSPTESTGSQKANTTPIQKPVISSAENPAAIPKKSEDSTQEFKGDTSLTNYNTTVDGIGNKQITENNGEDSNQYATTNIVPSTSIEETNLKHITETNSKEKYINVYPNKNNKEKSSILSLDNSSSTSSGKTDVNEIINEENKEKILKPKTKANSESEKSSKKVSPKPVYEIIDEKRVEPDHTKNTGPVLYPLAKKRGQKDYEFRNELYNLTQPQAQLAKEPVMWFRTTDANIWDKLNAVDEKCNVVYLFQLPSQPRVEKETIRTIHTNGTIVEERTELVWEHDEDIKPKVIKTTTVILPDKDGRKKQ